MFKFKFKCNREIICYKITDNDRIVSDSYVQYVVTRYCNKNEINLKSIYFDPFFKITILLQKATKEDTEKLGRFLLHECYDTVCNLKY